MIMAAACFPTQVARVQEQIDLVVRRNRGMSFLNRVFACGPMGLFRLVPRFEDEENLPLVTAFYQESQRWRPVGPAGRS